MGGIAFLFVGGRWVGSLQASPLYRYSELAQNTEPINLRIVLATLWEADCALLLGRRKLVNVEHSQGLPDELGLVGFGVASSFEFGHFCL